MRAIWKGAISFGLVTVPVRLYTATENHNLQFHQVRVSDGSRIRYKRVAEADGAEVPYDQIAKGYEAPDGRTVILTDEDLAGLPNRSSKEISVEKFVPAAQIDPLLFDSSYYLEPDKMAAKPYALLREALRESDRMAVVTVSVRTRMTMAVLRVRDDVLVLQTMLWPDEIREPDFGVLDEIPEPSAPEVAMANMLIESMAADFEPNDYEDDYRRSVEELVAAKLAGGEATEPPGAKEDTGTVVDLLAALQQSVERAKAARAGGSETGADEDSTAPERSAQGDSDAAQVGEGDPGADDATADAAKGGPEPDAKLGGGRSARRKSAARSSSRKTPKAG